MLNYQRVHDIMLSYKISCWSFEIRFFRTSVFSSHQVSTKSDLHESSSDGAYGIYAFWPALLKGFQKDEWGHHGKWHINGYSKWHISMYIYIYYIYGGFQKSGTPESSILMLDIPL